MTELCPDFRYNTLELGTLIRDLRRVGFRIEFIRRPAFEPDYARAWSYERANGVVNLDRTLKFDFEPYEWLELRCLRPL